MAWTASKIFSAYITDSLNRTLAYDLNADTITVALYNDSITPSQTVASGSTGYGAGVWTAGSSPNIQDASGWVYAGRNLAGVASGFASNVYTFDANDLASGTSTTSLTAATGCLVYDNTLAADDGICYNYFGGSNTITSGTFTIVWHATNGIFNLTL